MEAISKLRLKTCVNASVLAFSINSRLLPFSESFFTLEQYQFLNSGGGKKLETLLPTAFQLQL